MPRDEVDHEQFARVVSYYLDCIFHDADREILLRQHHEGRRFIPLGLDFEWGLSDERELNIDLTKDFQQLGLELQRLRNAGEITYGYPLLAKRTGSRRMEFAPVFLQSVDHYQSRDSLSAKLVHDWPDDNREFSSWYGAATQEETCSCMKGWAWVRMQTCQTRGLLGMYSN